MHKPICFLIFILVLLSEACIADWQWASENDFILQNTKIFNSVINPENQVLKIPETAASVDLRPELSWKGDDSGVLIRPRWVGAFASGTEGRSAEKFTQAEARWNVTDAYLRYSFGGNWQMNAGLEVYQWGPAELFNASNPYFHLYTDAHGAFFKEKGLAIVRLTWDPAPDANYMLIMNPVTNQEASFRSEQNFHASGIVKCDWRFFGGRGYLGALAGMNPDQDAVAGLYANALNDAGWSLYFDGKVMARDRSFQPTSLGGSLLLEPASQNRPTGIYLAGIRHEGAQDARLEWLHNPPGYSRQNFLRILDSFSNPGPFTGLNTGRFLRSGLELPGQDYVYLSIRFPNLGKAKENSLFFRELLSIGDASGLTQLNFEVPWGNSLILEFEFSIFSGINQSEFTLLDQYQSTLGFKWLL